MNKEVLIEVKNLKKYFPIKKGIIRKSVKNVKAVDGVTFTIYKGETFGLVGESGCGKSTAGRTLIRLYDVTEGSIIYEGKDISKLSQKELLPYRKKIQMIFQDPYSSLNTRMTVSDIIGEALDIHKIAVGEERKNRIAELLESVGLKEEHASRYPHEFSGGQRQRVGIARALAVDPEFIICDEPISALDVSIQAQVVNMLEDIQKKTGVTFLFIAHDLSMVRHISDRIGVMYLGQLIEVTESDELYENPLHPYTQALLSSVPDPYKDMNENRIRIEGEIPSPIDPPPGCRFSSRCAHVLDICKQETPELVEVGAGHLCACHLVKGEQ